MIGHVRLSGTTMTTDNIYHTNWIVSLAVFEYLLCLAWFDELICEWFQVIVSGRCCWLCWMDSTESGVKKKAHAGTVAWAHRMTAVWSVTFDWVLNKYLWRLIYLSHKLIDFYAISILVVCSNLIAKQFVVCVLDRCYVRECEQRKNRFVLIAYPLSVASLPQLMRRSKADQTCNKMLAMLIPSILFAHC